MSYSDRYCENEAIYSWVVYVLYLEDEKWYVGLTHDVERRFEEHCNGRGAEWTRIHKPIEIVFRWHTPTNKRAEGEDIENKTTIEMMKVFGRENVRGGYYVAIDQNAVDEMLGVDTCEELDNLFTRKGREYFETLVEPNLRINRFDEISRQERRNKKPGTQYKPFYKISSDNKEIHIKFPKRPPQEVRDRMKSKGWIYKRYASYWQNRVNGKNLIFAKDICGEIDSRKIEETHDTIDSHLECNLSNEFNSLDFQTFDYDFEEELSTEEWAPLFEETNIQQAEYVINTDKNRVEIYFFCDPGNDIKSLLYADKWHYYGAKHFWHKKYSYKTIENRTQFAKEICEVFNKNFRK